MKSRFFRLLLFKPVGRQMLAAYDAIKLELAKDVDLSFALHLMRDTLFPAVQNVRHLPGNATARQALWLLLAELIDRSLASGAYTESPGELSRWGRALVDLWQLGYTELVDTGLLSQAAASEQFDEFYGRALSARKPSVQADGRQGR